MAYPLMPEKRRFSRYVLPFMASNMYVLAEGEDALVIDPQPSEEACAALQRTAAGRILVLLTHEHFDHTSGVNFFRRHIPSVRVLAHAETAHHIETARNNRPLALLKMGTEENRAEIMEAYRSYPMESISVDAYLADGQELLWHGHVIDVVEVPGHSPGSLLFSFDDGMVFTGDYLIPRTAVILRYPGGSEEAYERVTLPKLKAIPNGRLILPGHGAPYRFDGRAMDWNQRR